MRTGSSCPGGLSMPRKGSAYGPRYESQRRRLLGKPCKLRLVCDGARATEVDHVPPVSRHRHVDGSGCCRLQPACGPCQRRQAVDLANETRRGQAVMFDLDEVPEADGFPVESPVWDVSWLDDLREVPADAVWPRLMTIPHPRAVGSLGGEFEVWVRENRGITLRWWQRLVVRRLLEVDDAGELVWMVLLLTLARQLGKSWLLQMLLAWRLVQGPRFGCSQLLLHMSIQMAQVRDVMERELQIAEALPDRYHQLDNNNATEITWLADGSKWRRIVKGTSRGGGAYGQSGVSVAVVDEAWSIPSHVVDDGLEPTIVEGVQPWLAIVSTAHRMATALMMDRRVHALEALDTGDDALLVEWSTPRFYDLDDVGGWRLASPHWSRQREQLIRGAVRRAMSGFASEDPTEPDPVEAVRSQWLNQWPAKLTVRGKVEALVDPTRWADLTVDGEEPRRLWVAVAENFGRGAGVVAVAEIGDGRYEVDGWTCVDRDVAVAQARATLDARAELPGVLVAEPSLASIVRDGEAATPADIRFGLPLVRELVDSGRLVHDVTPELDQQMGECRVRPVSGGLAIASTVRSDLVRAAALALRSAVVRTPLPAIGTWKPPAPVVRPRRAGSVGP